jgi:hypothetical protein
MTTPFNKKILILSLALAFTACGGDGDDNYTDSTAAQTAGPVLASPGAPKNSLGVDGDYFLNTATGQLYGPKAGGMWPANSIGIATGTAIAGVNGTNGNTLLNGTTPPSNAQGRDGDFYLNTSTKAIFGPKAANTWPSIGLSLGGADGLNGMPGPAGANGNTIYSGTGIPANTQGMNGDFYIDTTALLLYGPKASNTWPVLGQSLAGTAGAAGAPGAAGPVGPAGVNGAAGTPGSTIFSGAGSPAPATGVPGDYYIDSQTSKLYGPKTGADWSTSATLSLTGKWVTVATTTAQALPNIGYLADNAAQVTLTLPPSAALTLGDTVRITGTGAGGWRIAQNVGQTIQTQNIPAGSQYGLVWQQTSLAPANWRSIAMSSDAKYLVAGNEANGYLYTSSDRGETWVQRTSSGLCFWKSVASSTDGKNLAAVCNNGNVTTSTDYGVSWTAHAVAGSVGLQTISSSANGKHLLVGDAAGGFGNGSLYTSADYGVTWTAQASAGVRNWRSTASSASGQFLAAGNTANGGYIYTSANYGVSWTEQTGSGLHRWISIASSSDGKHLAAADELVGDVYTSADSGVSWTKNATGGPSLKSIASSSDGQYLAAVGIATQYVYTSANFGSTWKAAYTNIFPFSIASSADGKYLATGSQQGGSLFISSPQTTPGPTGSLSGSIFDAVELQYVGADTFILINSTVRSGNFNVQ